MPCPKGKIERVAYTRKSRKGSRVHVPKTCIPDRGRPGKTPKSQRLPTPGKDISLRKYGYSVDKPAYNRHKALMAAARDTDEYKVLKHLNLVRNIQAYDQDSKRKMSADVNFMKGRYAEYKKRHSRGGSKKKSRKGSRKSSRRGSRR
jgi:hypothetical protein